jgi:hypothetical protein
VARVVLLLVLGDVVNVVRVDVLELFVAELVEEVVEVVDVELVVLVVNVDVLELFVVELVEDDVEVDETLVTSRAPHTELYTGGCKLFFR